MTVRISVLIVFLSTVCFSQENKKFITMGEVWKQTGAQIGYGILSVKLAEQAGKYDGYNSKEALANAGFETKDDFDKQMAFAVKSEYCLKKLNAANASSRAPVRYYGDSSELMIHVNGSKVHIYTPDGMIEIEGTNCKAVDGKKNVVDGLINIAQRAVNVNSKKGIGESEEIQKEQSKRVIDMLQACGQVDSKFESYSKETLQEKYKVAFQDRTRMTVPPAGTKETADEAVK